MVSIIACTMRDQMMDNVFANYARQKWETKELIIILNNDRMDLNNWSNRAKKYSNISIYQLPEEKTLGDCLNFGISKARYDIIAKFDDDDYYSPYYLTEAMTAFKKTGAEVIGKGTSFLYFEQNDLLTLYRQGLENKDGSKFLKGGTLMFKKSLFPKIKFPSQKAGSDSHFRNQCKENNVKMYSTSRYNYVCLRRADLTSHTYQLPPEEYMKNCEVVETTKNFESAVTKRFGKK
ncbi:hypothetical protein CVD25_14640 [Bacillus canaveralius]|uniref:Glycosyltransferase 2-like domain-containing protein n=1 Tax=Bacillus canaveralius TaxID=1403243 RepID=A0A2N5GHQ0_9BACI|nr:MULTISPECIES: glycosyltransferase [Bacillus]PLR80325.1 hypothetical protein CU635_18595 [Bacillus canaveralius]PLR85809.1 hypothetical protein CVD23_07690 [Bacillus sp. V33-4]PLR95456.1 hypothetical protein CVD25_14640 [Bacillus canaveralius]RSK48692.1 glycosyltransferase [Bacillus canaveralius]